MPSEGSENENADIRRRQYTERFLDSSLDEDQSGLGLVESRPFGMKMRLKACYGSDGVRFIFGRMLPNLLARHRCRSAARELEAALAHKFLSNCYRLTGNDC